MPFGIMQFIYFLNNNLKVICQNDLCTFTQPKLKKQNAYSEKKIL